MKTAVDQLIEKMSLEDVCKYSNELADAKEMEKEREKSIFSIAYRMTPIEFGKEYCESEFEKFNKTFKQQEQ
jgi:predicted metalloendopeptidase